MTWDFVDVGHVTAKVWTGRNYPQVELKSLRPSNMVSSSPGSTGSCTCEKLKSPCLWTVSGMISRISIFSNSTFIFNLCTDTDDPHKLKIRTFPR